LHHFTRPDELSFQAANGWLELGNWREANEELENITPLMRAHPEVLQVRCEIYCAAQKWDYAAEVANALCAILPESSFGPLHLAHALRKLDRTREARDALLPVADKFPDEWHIPYQLACYYSWLREFDDAQEWFKRAMAIEEDIVKRAGIDDPDLKPLWDSMSGTLWKRE
jgi:tetratricopeptide (TPR) repeat protein